MDALSPAFPALLVGAFFVLALVFAALVALWRKTRAAVVKKFGIDP